MSAAATARLKNDLARAGLKVPPADLARLLPMHEAMGRTMLLLEKESHDVQPVTLVLQAPDPGEKQ